MNRIEFMETLSRLLLDIPEEDRIDALKYYNDYFDDAGSENEQNVIEELESPEKVAMKIKADREDTGTTEEYDTDTGKGRQKELQIPNTRLRRIRKIHISIIRRTDPEMKKIIKYTRIMEAMSMESVRRISRGRING